MPTGHIFLAQRVKEGVRKRYAAKRNLFEKAQLQVRHQLKLIEKLGFAGYFLYCVDLNPLQSATWNPCTRPRGRC